METSPAGDLTASSGGLLRPGPVIGLMSLAHFFHHLLTALVVPLLPFIRDSFGLTYAQSGLLYSAFSLAYGAGQPPAGLLADRIGPRVLLVVGISGVALAGAFIGVAPAYGLLVLGLVLMGLTGGGYHPAASPVISAVVPPKSLGRALGFHLAGGSSSHFLAPLLGVFLAGLWGWRGAFLSISIPVMLFGLVLYPLLGGTSRRDRTRRDAEGKAPEAEDRAQVPILTIVLLLIVSTTISATVASVLAFVPLFIVDTYGATEQLAAAYLSLVYFTGLFAGPLGGHLSDRFGPIRLIVVVGVLLAPSLLLLTVVPFGAPLAAVLLLIGILMFFRMPTAEAFLVGVIPKRYRSTVLGLYFFAGMEAGGVLTPLVGHLIDQKGFRTGFLTIALYSGLLTLGCGIALLRTSRRTAAARGRPKAER